MKITIDGRSLEAHEKESVLSCAVRNDIPIPRLCTHPNLKPFGACRMCVVQIEGMRGYPSSCSTPVVDGMVVHSNTEALQELRHSVLELILLEHPASCLLCARQEACDSFRPIPSKAGRTTGCHTCGSKAVCNVRSLAEEFNIKQLPVPPTYRQLPLDRSDPFIDRDPNLCILCGRCVGICREHHGVQIIDFVGRGSDTRIGTAFGRPLTEVNCRFCGSCIDVCPTGSLADRYAKWFGKPRESVETSCMLCEAACAIRVGASGQGSMVTAISVDPGIPICLLGRFGIPELLASNSRLTVPKMRVGEVLREVTWEQAIAEAAARLAAFVGDQFALVCDITSTLEDRQVFERFTREVMKSPHYIEIQPSDRGVSQAPLPAGVKAALLTGAFVADDALDTLDVLVVQDIYPTAASERADVVLPVAAFTEVDGSWLDGSGIRRPLHKACKAPGRARPEWQITAELGRAMDAADFEFEDVLAIGERIDVPMAGIWVDRDTAPAAALNPAMRRTHFRGHCLADKIRGLQDLSDV